jgi:error-prone DNA polymerase
MVGSVSQFAELVCRTAFSFHEGASQPEEIVAQAAETGLHAVAITDRDGVYGLPRAHKAAQAHGVRILPGALLTITDGPGVALLARDVGGWSQLTRLITEARKDMKKGWGQIPLPALLERASGLEAILLGSRDVWTATMLLAGTNEQSFPPKHKFPWSPPEMC